MRISSKSFLLLLGCLFWLTASFSYAQTVTRSADSMRNYVVYRDTTGLLNVSANNMAVRDFTELFSEETGIEIELFHRADSWPPLSVTFRDVELQAGIRAIFKNFNKIVTYTDADEDQGRIVARIELLSVSNTYGFDLSNEDVETQSDIAENSAPVEFQQEIIDPATSERRSEMQKLIDEAIENYDSTAAALLTSLLREEADPAIREAAAIAIAGLDDKSLTNALIDSVLTEQTASVRYQAIRGLSNIRGEGWEQIIVDVIESDPDPAARRIAILTAPSTSAAIETAIQMADDDENQLVRSAALLKLNRADEIEQISDQ